MNLIVAVDSFLGIGKGNKLLFTLPKDLEYFKQKTISKVVVMGHNTFKSLPNSRALKNRTNIVLSQSLEDGKDYTVVKNMEDLKTKLKEYDSDDIFIIGGEMLYSTMLDYCKNAYVTKVFANGCATHFFPDLDQKEYWSLVDNGELQEDNGQFIVFCQYENFNVKEF